MDTPTSSTLRNAHAQGCKFRRTKGVARAKISHPATLRHVRGVGSTMTTKKNTTRESEEGKCELEELLAALEARGVVHALRPTGELDGASIAEAFRRLTGVHPKYAREGQPELSPAHGLAFEVMVEAIAAVLVPSPERTKWLDDVGGQLLERLRDAPPSSTDLRRTRLLKNLPALALRAAACQRFRLAGKDFAGLTPENATRIIKKLKPDRKGNGATHRGAATVAAELSLACGAFGDERRVGESEQRAINRVATAYRQAAKRAALPLKKSHAR